MTAFHTLAIGLFMIAAAHYIRDGVSTFYIGYFVTSLFATAVAYYCDRVFS